MSVKYTKMSKVMNSSQVSESSLDLPKTFEELLKCRDNTTCLRIVKEIENERLSEASLKEALFYLSINITSLDKSWEPIIHALLKINWRSWTDILLLQEYKSFLLHLLSAHTYYIKIVLQKLITSFIVTDDDQCEEMENQGFLYIHSTLQDILKVAPMAFNLLVPILTKSFPYMGLNVSSQVSYTRNLLHMTSYLPHYRKSILEIIIAHLIKLDVHSSKEDILLSEEMGKMDVDDEPIFPLEEDKCKERSADSLFHKLGNTLDCLMEVTFESIKSFCYNEEELNWTITKELYQELFGIFEKIILPTHACCHVQFLMFYICSFKNCLAENFLDVLWKKVINPNTPTVIRQVSAAYIGSALARALYIPISTVKTCLDLISSWIHQYINFQVSSTKNYPDINLHGAFYSVCQTLFYVFAFRHKELMEMPKGFAYMRGLNLQRIVNCRLNPLKLCLPVVVKNFANISRRYQLVYCYTIIEKNERCVIPVASSVESESTNQSNKNPLDSFFPFDPFILIRSVKYITPLFREYKGDMDEIEKLPEKEDEDDFLIEDEFVLDQEIDPIQTPTKMDLFRYGTSPGFKK